MEYSFTKNDLGYPQARLNMEAEAFGHWLSIDMSGKNRADLVTIVNAVEGLLNKTVYEFEYQGNEFFLELSRDTAKVSVNNLAPHPSQTLGIDQQIIEQIDEQEWSEDFDEELSETDSGLVAYCGLEDFRILLVAWIEYVGS